MLITPILALEKYSSRVIEKDCPYARFTHNGLQRLWSVHFAKENFLKENLL